MAIRHDIPFTTKVVKTDKHNDDYITVWLKGGIDIIPGQFIMVWLPGVEEKPFAVTNVIHEKEKGLGLFSITAQKRGMFTSKLFDLKHGDVVGYRGPYGKGFTLVENKQVCIVAGGIGIAALFLLYSKLKKNNKVVLIYGAKSCLGLVFKEAVCDCALHLCTDDGSEGKKAFTTQLLEEQLSSANFDIVYACGPEAMMKNVVEICINKGIACEASLERYMSCGFGVCGKCAINNRLVCADGPVFSSDELQKLSDFGSPGCKCKNH